MKLFSRNRKRSADIDHPRVSVLVPIYNTERYLRHCLQCLVDQTLRDIEIICINDGSTDSSSDIIAGFASRDARIRVIDKPNSGYGDSMNKGIEAARGDWIGICEPDDFVDRGMYAAYLRAGERHRVDLVKSNYYEYFDEGHEDNLMRVFDGFPYGRAFTPADHIDVVRVRPAIWSALYRRSMIVDNGIRFSPTPGASFQDTSFVQQCWIAARKVVLLSRGYLHYRMDNTASSSRSGEKVFAICGEYERTFRFLRSRGEQDLRTFGPILNAMRFDGYAWNYNRISPEHHEEFAKRWAAEMRQVMDEGLFDESLLVEYDRQRLHDLLDDPVRYCVIYPE